jgi:hypothetical protein
LKPVSGVTSLEHDTAKDNKQASPAAPAKDAIGDPLASERLLPSPALQSPTTTPQQARPITAISHIPSSPPAAASIDPKDHPNSNQPSAHRRDADPSMESDHLKTFTTPRLPRYRPHPGDDASPTKASNKHVGGYDGHDDRPEVNLTSSVVKGRAATGLLALGRR